MNFFELGEAAVQFTGIETVRQRPANGWHWSGYEAAPRPANGLICVCDNITLHYRQKNQPDFELHRGELAAAISAAVAEELGTSVSGIRIVSIKKV